MFLVLVSFLRGWIRTSVVPSYVAKVYQNKINSTFSREFTPIDNQLGSYGLTFSPNDIQSQCGREGSIYFTGISESVGCEVYGDSNKLPVTNTLIANWDQQLPKLKSYLETNGWQYPISNQPASTNPNKQNGPPYEMVYMKLFGKTRCNLSFRHTYAPNPYKVWAAEDCYQDVSFFGGY